MSTPARLLMAAVLGLAAIAPAARGAALEDAAHLVISELVTGGTSASDEFIEIHNPSALALPLEGLELVYVSASGLTVSRRAAWEVGAGSVPPGGHVLIANELGPYASIADAAYASGLAATGGSVALRIQGAATAIDALGWGTAASSWMEGSPAPAPAAGSSLERLPGGALGSGVDTGDNAADFVERAVPEPQNASSAPTPDPGSASPTPGGQTPTPPPSAPPTPAVTASPSPAPALTIGQARALSDGATATIEGVALTAADFHDGGGFVADTTGGIAVLVEGGNFPRGALLRITGSVDDRFAQRTLRADASGVVVSGTAGDPQPLVRSTASITEEVEGRLVRSSGTITGAATQLSAGVAFDVDDGSGPVRVIVGGATGIDVAAWTPGSIVTLVGVAGQRDSSGAGSSGYRLQPRDAGDVIGVTASTASPTPGETASAEPSTSASPSPDAPAIVSIAEARAAPKNSRVTIAGTVTMPPGIVDAGSAVVQDASAAILLRLGDEVGALSRGARVEVTGTRSTKGGMESLRVTQPPLRASSGVEPAFAPIRTGDAHEVLEAQLVVASGALPASARRASSGTVSFEIDDGSGPLRVVLGAALGASTDALTAGTWVEVRGVLGQETTGALPLRGYRIWPRDAGDVRIVAAAGDAGDGPGAGSTAGDGHGGAGGPASLDGLDGAGVSGLRVGATLVAGPWSEMQLGGVLWDGHRLVGLRESAAPHLEAVLVDRAPPTSVELVGLAHAGASEIGLPLVTLDGDDAEVIAATAPVAVPATALPEDGQPPTWVSLVGRLVGGSGRPALLVGDERVPIERRCASKPAPDGDRVSVTGIGVADGPRLIVGCDGIRPAPSLALTASDADRSQLPATAESGDAQPTDRAAIPGRRIGAVGLLIAGVLVVVGGTLASRRFAATEEEDRPTEEEAPQQPAEAPRLTLVPVQPEHGPR